MTYSIIVKLRSAFDHIVKDLGSVFILLFILVLTYLLFSSTFYQEQAINASWDSLSYIFYLLVIGVALRFLRPNETRVILRCTHTFLLLAFFFVLASSLFTVVLHPLQAPLEIINVLAFGLLVAGVLAGLLSYVVKINENKLRH